MSWVSSPSDCSTTGAGETGKAPGSTWDGDKMVGPCLQGTERWLEVAPVEEVDQLIDDGRLEKKAPKKDELADESGSVVVVVVERGLSILLGGDRAGLGGGSCGISSTSKGGSTVSRVNAQLVSTSFGILTKRACTRLALDGARRALSSQGPRSSLGSRRRCHCRPSRVNPPES